MRTQPQKRFFIALLAITLGLGGCAGGGSGTGGGTGSGAQATGGRRTSNRITAEELATVSELDLHAAVNRLRPAWLRAGSRGTLPAVILDGSPQTGGVDVMSSMRAADVASLEFMSASDATTRYGTGYSAGAIVITTHR